MDSAAIEIPTPLPTEVRVKPVLKHPEAASSTKSSAAMLDNEGSGGVKTTGEEKKHLTWDEHAIEEHDLLRGTRMKVRMVTHQNDGAILCSYALVECVVCVDGLEYHHIDSDRSVTLIIHSPMAFTNRLPLLTYLSLYLLCILILSCFQ